MNLQIKPNHYEPRAPSYAPTTPVCDEPWVIKSNEKIMCTIGTQYEKQPMPKKEKTKQWKLTRLYRRALTKHWIETEKTKKNSRVLRKILMDIFQDKKLCWSHAKETKLISALKKIRKEDGSKDEKILKWVKGVEKRLKKKFNKRKLK